MTFDELWRRNLTRSNRPVLSSIDTPAEFSGDAAPIESVFDDLDEAEMNDFLEWLETTLLEP
ncbi:MAG: hypothetical protein JO061_07280 [Acidobacteriaceae bacterium]|nr:hypothetical protein [Acidobacteriaceae bacterium]